MKKLLLALLLSIGLVGAQQVVDRLEAALRSEDRASLEPLFQKGFSFETTYDHTGDANEAIDWILNKTIHGSFESLIAMENSDSYVVEIKFQGTHIQLLLSISKASGLIYVGSFQTNGPAVTTTTTTQVPVKTPRKWYVELLEAMRQKNKERILDLIGNTYYSDIGQETILSMLLKNYDTTNLIHINTTHFFVRIKYIGDTKTFYIRGNYGENGVRVQQIEFVLATSTTVPITTTTTTTSKPVTTSVDFYNALLKAIREQDKSRIRQLFGTKYISILTEGQILAKLFANNFIHAGLTPHDNGAFDVIFEYENQQTLKIHCTTGGHQVKVIFIRLINNKPSTTTTPVTTTQPWIAMTKEQFYEMIVKAVNKKDKKQISELIGDIFQSDKQRDYYLKLLSETYFNSTLKTLNDKNSFLVIFLYTEDLSVIISGEQSEAGVRINKVRKSWVLDRPPKTTETPSTTESAPVWLSMTRDCFYKEIVKAVDEKNKERISDLIGNHFHVQLSRDVVIESLLHHYFNTSFKYFHQSGRFLVTFQYTDGSRILIFGREGSTTNSVRCIGIYRSEVPEPTVTLAPPVVKSPRIFYIALLQAIRRQNKPRILQLIGRTYKSILTEEQILEKLFTNYLRPELVIIPNFIFKVSFEYSDGSKLSLYGKSDDINAVNVTIISLTKSTTTVAPTATTPCSVSQQQKYLAKFHKTMGEWQASIYQKDVNHLSSLIDDNFKMIYDQEETNSNKKRLVRSLMEGKIKAYTPQKNLEVKVEDGLIRIHGKSKPYMYVTLWFREEEKALILIKANYDKML